MRRLGLAAAISLCPLSAVGCFVSIDEGLLDQPGSPTVDASVDVSTEGGRDGSIDGDSATADVVIDGAKDAPDSHTDAADTGPSDAKDSGPGECSEDVDCPPIDTCTLRSCQGSQCVETGTMTQEVTSFELPAAPKCNQSHSDTCFLAVGTYVVALTESGVVVFNLRNPISPKQESLPSNIPEGTFLRLTRSGQQVWTTTASSLGSATIAWLDLPGSGTGPLSAPSSAQVSVFAILANFAAPNDALYVQTADSPPSFARFAPGLPTTLESFNAADSAETLPEASSASRMLMHSLTPNGQLYDHYFSLETNVATSSASNTGTTYVGAATTQDSTPGYFATSRSGTIAWMIPIRSSGQLLSSRIFWLITPGSTTIDPLYNDVETYSSVQPLIPVGPMAFVDDSTIAAAVVQGGASSVPMLDIVQGGASAPTVSKRIPLGSFLGSLAGISVAADSGYAYVVDGTTVHVFAPACN